MKETDMAARRCRYTLTDGETGFTLSAAGMKFSEPALDALGPACREAHREMGRIEAGEIKNPDERRKVTHFTDRMAYPESPLCAEAEAFAAAIRSGKLRTRDGKRFKAAVINGIGGSALGPQLVQFALNGPYWNELGRKQRDGGLRLYFLDNTDSAGIADLLAVADLATTLVVTISKSGGTLETKNNLVALERAYRKAKLPFAQHACAITMPGSELDQQARAAKWLKILPLADSIGGRTSETSIVGHLPAALAGIDFRALLAGACRMDAWTRDPEVRANPAYLLACMWYIAGGGRGDRNMVIVPYADRLVLLSRYLQQLVMESLGKELDRQGKPVHQGLNVFGNKGGTDAHAFIQQLNDGRDDFFVTFIEVWRDALQLAADGEVSMGDYLHGFQAGLAAALLAKGRQVIEIRIRAVDAENLGMLIALYERAVAFYAELIGINAFHQPGVQAYKKASGEVIAVNRRLQAALAQQSGFSGSAAELAKACGLGDQAGAVAGWLAKFAENAETRRFPGFRLSRTWCKDAKAWVYQVNKKS
jgi:glucose-6-phosphate isomerase